ncbi:MAG: hypothetical protein MJ252_19060 [archaeon]|nr:hypothetical protein [archaeon]
METKVNRRKFSDLIKQFDNENNSDIKRTNIKLDRAYSQDREHKRTSTKYSEYSNQRNSSLNKTLRSISPMSVFGKERFTCYKRVRNKKLKDLIPDILKVSTYISTFSCTKSININIFESINNTMGIHKEYDNQMISETNELFYTQMPINHQKFKENSTLCNKYSNEFSEVNNSAEDQLRKFGKYDPYIGAWMLLTEEENDIGNSFNKTLSKYMTIKSKSPGEGEAQRNSRLTNSRVSNTILSKRLLYESNDNNNNLSTSISKSGYKYLTINTETKINNQEETEEDFNTPVKQNEEEDQPKKSRVKTPCKTQIRQIYKKRIINENPKETNKTLNKTPSKTLNKTPSKTLNKTPSRTMNKSNDKIKRSYGGYDKYVSKKNKNYKGNIENDNHKLSKLEEEKKRIVQARNKARIRNLSYDEYINPKPVKKNNNDAQRKKNYQQNIRINYKDLYEDDETEEQKSENKYRTNDGTLNKQKIKRMNKYEEKEYIDDRVTKKEKLAKALEQLKKSREQIAQYEKESQMKNRYEKEEEYQGDYDNDNENEEFIVQNANDNYED